MVQIGKKVKYDSYGRVTIPSELAELLDLIKGEDEITWDIIDGNVMVFKVTKTYAGHDFEAEEIESRLRSYEEKYRDDYEIEDPEAAEQKAWEEYQKDKVARQALKEKRNQ